MEVVNVDEEAQIISLTKSPPKSPRRSPRSNRKRKFEDLTTENDAPIIDLSADNQPQETQEPSPKKQKLDKEEPEKPLSTLSALSKSNDFSDITFKVGDEQFYGLKAIFAIKSVVFRNMLYPQFGGQPQEIRYIEITDISPEAFKFIRDFFYDLNPEITFENVVNVLNASKNYAISTITTQCNEFLNKIDNVNDLLSVLSQFGAANNTLNDELNELLNSDKIIDLLQNNGKEIIDSEIFGSLPFEMAKKFIESDNLGVSEDLLWNATKQWLSSNGDELKQIIRFCRMETDFIFNEIKNCGILNDIDLCSIYERKLGLNTNDNTCPFNCNPRFEPKPKSRRGGRRKAKASPKKAEKEEETAEKEAMEVEENNAEEVEVEPKTEAEAEEEEVVEDKFSPIKTRRGRRKSAGKGGSRKRSKSKGKSKKKKKN